MPSAPNGPGRWRQVADRTLEILRAEGLPSLWFRALGETVYRRMILYKRLLSDPIPAAAASVQVTISLLRIDQAEEFLVFRGGSDAAWVRTRLKRGDKCFIARHEGVIVNACWTTEAAVWIDYLRCTVELARDEAFVYDNYTSPPFRSLNIPLVRAAEMLGHFSALGYRRLLATIVPENKPAFRPVEKAGYRRIGVMGYVKLGPWRYDFGSLAKLRETGIR